MPTASLRLLLLLLLSLVGCSSGEGGSDPPEQQAPPAPAAYSAGQCPTLSAGENLISSGGSQRRVLLLLPGEPQGAALLFAWHWQEGGPYQVTLATGLHQLEGVIVVAPFARGDAPFAWHVTEAAQGNPDLLLFDDLLACLHQQFAVDLRRVWTTGVSAGALWSAYLLQHRSQQLAAAALLSGGQPDPSEAPPYRSPERDLPVLLAWGGPGDTHRIAGANFVYNAGDPEVFDFAEASTVLSGLLRDDGHFRVHCVGSYGHSLPPDPLAVVWPFLRDHPWGVTPEPWATAPLPADLSPLCQPVP